MEVSGEERRESSSFSSRSALRKGPRSRSGRAACLGGAVDRYRQCQTDLAHSHITEPTEPLSECTSRDAFNRIQIHSRSLWNRVVSHLEHNLARETPNRGSARSNQSSSQPWDHSVTGHENDGATGDLGQLAPPDLSPRGQACHDDAAASRNEARSPHSSPSSSGCSS